MRIIYASLLLASLASCSDSSSTDTPPQPEQIPLSEGIKPISFTLKVSDQRVAPILSATTQVSDILASSNCLSCHNSNSALGSLDLSASPIVWRNTPVTSAEDIEAFKVNILDRVQSEQAPMPPFGELLSTSAVDVLKQWIDDLLAAYPGSLEAELTIYEEGQNQAVYSKRFPAFENELNASETIGLKEGGFYNYKLQLLDSRGNVVEEVVGENLEIAKDENTLKIEVNLN